MPRILPDNDRKKNQFGKEERFHLLSIMKRHAPLLDKSTSTLVRKDIWTSIEDEFKGAGFTGKTSAQLKKYWQNYKYHCKKARALGKDNEKLLAQSGDIDKKVTAINELAEWDRYQVFVENRPTKKLLEVPGIPRQFSEDPQRVAIDSEFRPSEIYEDNEGSFRKFNVSTTMDVSIDSPKIKVEAEHEDSTLNNFVDMKGDVNTSESINFNVELSEENRIDSISSGKMRNHVVVSNAKISDSSVTVSVIYPDAEENVPSTKNETKTRMEIHDIAKNSIAGDSTNNGDKENLDQAKSRTTKKDDFPNILKHPSSTALLDVLSKHGTTPDHDETNKSNKDRIAGCNSNDLISRYKESMDNVLHSDCQSDLKHRLILHQLEMEEKRLKVKIAEMAIQEIRLRIKALNEDMRRTEKLYRLHLALAMPENGDGSRFPGTRTTEVDDDHPSAKSNGEKDTKEDHSRTCAPSYFY